MRQQVALFASSTGANITAWELSTGSQLCTYKGNASPRNGVCVVGGQYLAAAQLGKGPIHFWAWHKESTLQRSFAGGQVTCLAASPCGSYLAAGGAGGALWVWAVGSGRLVTTWMAHLKAVTAVAWSYGGSFLVTGSEDTQVHVALVADLLGAGSGGGGGGGGGGFAMDVGGGVQGVQPLHTWSGHTLPVTSVAVGACESNCLVATASLDRTVKLWSLAQGALLRSINLGSTAECLSLAPGEQRLYVGLGSGDVAEVALAGAGEDDKYDGYQGGGGGASSSGVGGVPAAAAAGGVGYRLLKGHRDAVTCLASTTDGAHLVAGCRDGSARLFEAATRQVVRVMDSPAKGPITGLVLLDRQPGMGGASGGGGGGAPTRPLPLAQLCKYEGMAGSLQPWEGAAVLLAGCTGGDGRAGASSAGPGSTAAAAARGDGESAGDAAAQQLREDNARLAAQLAQTTAVARQWAGLHGQLYEACSDVLESRAGGGDA